MRKVIILRGIPGSGKSRWALDFVKTTPATIVSADHYFMDPDTGEYNFVPSQIATAHNRCRATFDAAITCRSQRIIVDNTNTQHWEYKHYVEAAKLHDYAVDVVSFKAGNQEQASLFANRNTHGVPVDKVLAMHERWED